MRPDWMRKLIGMQILSLWKGGWLTMTISGQRKQAVEHVWLAGAVLPLLQPEDWVLRLEIIAVKTMEAANKLEKFREWLQYDAECRFLPPEEQQIRWAEGRCPPPYTTQPPPTRTTKTRKKAFWRRKKPSMKTRILQKKQKFISFFSAGGQSRFEVDLKDDSKEYTVQQGAFLVVNCDVGNRGKYNETETISWYVNSNLVEVGLLDLRIIYGEKQELIIWPVQEDDQGYFECAVNGVHRASGIIEVVSQKEALNLGLVNYLMVMAIYFILSCLILFVVRDSLSKTVEVTEKEDKMAEFLEKQIMESRTAARENIAKIVHGEEFEKRKKEVEKSVYTKIEEDGKPARGNRDTVMSILTPPQEPPSAIRIR